MERGIQTCHLLSIPDYETIHIIYWINIKLLCNNYIKHKIELVDIRTLALFRARYEELIDEMLHLRKERRKVFKKVSDKITRVQNMNHELKQHLQSIDYSRLNVLSK